LRKFVWSPVRLRACFGNMARVLVPGRGFYIWGNYANCGNYPPVLKERGLYFSQAVIWVKSFLIELDPAYGDVIVERFEKFSGIKAERVRASKTAA